MDADREQQKKKSCQTLTKPKGTVHLSHYCLSYYRCRGGNAPSSSPLSCMWRTHANNINVFFSINFVVFILFRVYRQYAEARIVCVYSGHFCVVNQLCVVATFGVCFFLLSLFRLFGCLAVCLVGTHACERTLCSTSRSPCTRVHTQ